MFKSRFWAFIRKSLRINLIDKVKVYKKEKSKKESSAEIAAQIERGELVATPHGYVKVEKEKDKEQYYRKKSTPCNIDDLDNPRDCFIESNHTCKWSNLANRCNQVE